MPTCKTATGSIKVKLDLSRLNAELVHVCMYVGAHVCGGVVWPWRGVAWQTERNPETLAQRETEEQQASHAHDMTYMYITTIPYH